MKNRHISDLTSEDLVEIGRAVLEPFLFCDEGMVGAGEVLDDISDELHRIADALEVIAARLSRPEVGP